ncbi:hypothetical protein AAVH_42826, partial [Aphelenchoides avenae]
MKFRGAGSGTPGLSPGKCGVNVVPFGIFGDAPNMTTILLGAPFLQTYCNVHGM